MKPTTQHTAAFIQQLNEPVMLWDKITRARAHEAILSEIGNSAEPAAIIDILPFILARKPGVAAATAAAVHKLFLATPATDLLWLEEALRNRSLYSESFFEWHKLSPSQLALLERFADASASVLGLASFHRNGYVREAAINRLSVITTGAELPFLILRLNDWVANVRDAAYKALRSRIQPEYCRRFIANVTLLSRLEHAGRADHKPLVQAINQLLQSDECRAALLESLTSRDRVVRRAGFKLALDSTKPDLQKIVTMALDDNDTVIRTWAAQRISSAFAGETLEHFLHRMKHDPFMPVRRETLRIAVKLNSPRVVEELRTALLDRHASILNLSQLRAARKAEGTARKLWQVA